MPTDGLKDSSGGKNLLTSFADKLWCDNSVTIDKTKPNWDKDCIRNGNYLLPSSKPINGKYYSTVILDYSNGKGKVAVGTPDNIQLENRDLGPHYYLFLPLEYCDNRAFTNCQPEQTGVFKYPAKIRWCKSDSDAKAVMPAANACQATQSSSFPHIRYPIKAAGKGLMIRQDIVPSTNSYPYPGTDKKALTRTDCAGETCSYQEEMTNFANWWAYYRNRIQLMQTVVSRAFSVLDDRFRVGYMTIAFDPTTPTDGFMNLSDFTSGNRAIWYQKLFKARPHAGTPLHAALARAGRLYGGKLNNSSLDGVQVSDPVQFSCQRNYAILATDGVWSAPKPNEAVKLDGSDIGDEDGDLDPPQKDGLKLSKMLADVAAYYYKTDLRTGCASSAANVCDNNVPTSPSDPASHQHMTTSTIGLGLSGLLRYTTDYETAADSDFQFIKNGVVANPSNGICSWQLSGVCTWPSSQNSALSRVDDLWHAAVNGHGKYFSAYDSNDLSDALNKTLAAVIDRIGDAAAVTISNPNLAAGDNYAFSSVFTNNIWNGDIYQQLLDLNTGEVKPTKSWSAATKLDANPQAYANRKIYLFNAGAANGLRQFDWNNLSNQEKSYFSLAWIGSLSQLCSSGTNCLSSAAKANVEGANLINFLRGHRALEGIQSDISMPFRKRSSILGDIVNSEAAYIKAPLYAYADSGYAAFKQAKSTRAGMVYVGANDGMLHAFDALSGEEKWAYVPSMVLPNLYKLADKNYSTKHVYFVDGTPVQADVYIGGEWRTILVGGLNAGGRGYYALDVTDPDAPKALWEFTNKELGYSFGKPEITKLAGSGTWVVLFAFGYNNVDSNGSSSQGDGKGHLFVVKAMDGSLVRKISTEVGTIDTPSGLAQIRAWVDDATNNTAKYVYGGDLLGNLWRFDINNDAATGNPKLLATLKDAQGKAQPITSKPELGQVEGYPMVYVGTGRYLGISDISEFNQQTLYGIKDPGTGGGYGIPRNNAAFVRQTISIGTCPTGSLASICSAGETVRTGTANAVDLANAAGWYMDLPTTNERVSTDPQLVLGTLLFTANSLDSGSNVCSLGGQSYLYFLDYRSGGPVPNYSNGVIGSTLGSSLSTRAVAAVLPSGKITATERLSDNTTVVKTPPIGSASIPRRVSWREVGGR
ncbi:type IV pilus assembly protein PilY1 [Noviherbaspirillum humi]|uniref:Type IV pilus assembly protein PilY1 n=2 Tax=Noviherbaspirillum humi TaxID=1688639 RepID=A0A239LJ23_9BURK|nr:type IV pilus assembly protein PilY1 [Noviherbaspirillum humi]